MTLAESTAWAETALQAGDLEELARAIQARRNAISEALASKRPPTPQATEQSIQAGERLCQALDTLKRELNLESARLRRIQEGFTAGDPRAALISVRG